MRAIALLVACGCAAVCVSAAAAVRPSVRPASLDPVVVQGRYFGPHERVVVTFAAGQRATRRTVTDARGAFRLAFPGIHLGACRRYAIRAIASSGRVAVYVPRVLPDCLPVGNP